MSSTEAAALARTRWAWAIGTWFGVGWLRPGPGTYASAVAIVVWFLGRQASHLPWWTSLAAFLVTAVGVPASTIVAREAGREDPGFVVVDEVAGQLIALIGMRPDWAHALLSLILFRLFDIWKPWPVRRLEALPGGWGIMLDDVAAGCLALALGLFISHGR